MLYICALPEISRHQKNSADVTMQQMLANWKQQRGKRYYQNYTSPVSDAIPWSSKYQSFMS